MKFKRKLFNAGGMAIRQLKPYHYFRLKDDDRETFPYKLVFMSGREGLGYMNASLISIYLTWDKLPEIIVVSDGTSLSKFEKEMIRWPRKVDILSWKDSAAWFAGKGNEDIARYAHNVVYGKKLVSLLHLAEQFPFLYSDTDVLWYGSPEEPDIKGSAPFIKMGQDVDKGFYTDELIVHLGEEKCVANTPFNSGLMYLHGDFSGYPKWKELCQYLSTRQAVRGQDFSEQTAFAILNNHFNTNTWWGPDEILIRTDDEFQLGYTGKNSPGIMARHYVHTRRTAFWRDFIYMCGGKRAKPDTFLQKAL